MALLNGLQIKNSSILKEKIHLEAPYNSYDPVPKSYVDSIAQGLDIKQSVKLATTENLDATYAYPNLTAVDNGALSIDSLPTTNGMRVLIKDQTDKTTNGLYTVLNLGSPTTPFILSRSDDANISTEIKQGMYVFVESGDVNGSKGFALFTDNPITLGDTDLEFTLFYVQSNALNAGNYLSKDIDTLNVEIGYGLQDNGTNKITILPKNTSIAVDIAGVSVSTLSYSDKKLLALATTADNDLALATSLTKTPIGYLTVFINGVAEAIANGNSEKNSYPCYFSADSGITAKSYATIAAGDYLYWNGSVAGYQLETTDIIELHYSSF